MHYSFDAAPAHLLGLKLCSVRGDPSWLLERLRESYGIDSLLGQLGDAGGLCSLSLCFASVKGHLEPKKTLT